MKHDRPQKGSLTRRRFIRGVGATVGFAAAPSILRGLRGAVFKDRGLSRKVRQGEVVARPEKGHAIHVVVDGLEPDRKYYYRFYAGGEASRVGTTRTFPAEKGFGHRHSHELRFGAVSCRHYEQGFFPAYGDIAKQDLDFVLHTGDYIYEGGMTSSPISPGRQHNSGEILSVEDYRNRYALYRLDEDLQAAHASCPFVVTWDDHEADNNYAGEIAEEGAPAQGAEFLERRRNAYQVYGESMPLRFRNRTLTRDGNLRLFRRLTFGDLAEIHVLDTRQFRTDQPAEDGFGSTDPDSVPLAQVFGEPIFDADGILDPDATLLGAEQERWLARNLRHSRARWNILAQQIMVTKWNLVTTGRLTVELNPNIPEPLKSQILATFDRTDNIFNVDAWDGYQAARERLFDLLRFSRPSNPVVLTGDIHSAWAANLLDDVDDPDSNVLAAEFVCTSISSTFLGIDPRPTDFIVRPGVIQDNPHIEFFNGLFRGYCICEVNKSRWKTTFRGVGTLADVQNPDPLALVPMKDSPVEDDAVVSIRLGFSDPRSDERLETEFARVPL